MVVWHSGQAAVKAAIEAPHIKFFHRAATGQGQIGESAPRWLAAWIMTQQMALNRSYGAVMGTPSRSRQKIAAETKRALTSAVSAAAALAGNLLRTWLQQSELPLINLTLGIACLQQGMQRTTQNRHVQILQGFGFLFRYFVLSKAHMEAHFNLGRAFQAVGKQRARARATPTLLW